MKNKMRPRPMTGMEFVENLPVELIDGDKQQPRKDLGSLDDLKDSIRADGIIQPIIVSRDRDHRYKVLAGHRRLEAARQLRMASVPALIRTAEGQKRLELQLIENLHRKALNALEEAQALRRLIDEFGLSQSALARRFGLSSQSINQTLAILKLPQDIRDQIDSGKVQCPSKSVLLEIVRRRDADAQFRAWEKAKEGKLTVRQARETRNTARSLSYPIKLGFATVTIRFKRIKGSFGKAEQRDALEKAMNMVEMGEVGKRRTTNEARNKSQ